MNQNCKKNNLKEAYNSYCCLMAKYHVARPDEKKLLLRSIEEMREFLIRHTDDICVAS